MVLHIWVRAHPYATSLGRVRDEPHAIHADVSWAADRARAPVRDAVGGASFDRARGRGRLLGRLARNR